MVLYHPRTSCDKQCLSSFFIVIIFLLIDADFQCGGILMTSPGQFQSIDKDQDGFYDPDYACTWGIVAPANNLIHLEFLKMALASSRNWGSSQGSCTNTYVTVSLKCKPLIKSSAFLFCRNVKEATMANSVDPEQTAPTADDIFKCIFSWRFKG